MSLDPLPPLARAALLLDLDGTLLDIAPTPDSVVVPPCLPATLHTLRHRFGGALAVITGRPVEAIDSLLGNCVQAVAGEHGGAIRHAPGQAVERPDLPTPPEPWLADAAALAARFPGTILERKPRGFGLHFRLAPEAGPVFQAALASMLAGSTQFRLLQGHMLWEVRPVGVDKGDAVAALMRAPPFAGRQPIFIGDDVTDEDGMRVARSLGGAGLRVQDAFGDPAGVRAWLKQAAASEHSMADWPPLPVAARGGAAGEPTGRPAGRPPGRPA